jgi:AcrR family transcriptional regulator
MAEGVKRKYDSTRRRAQAADTRQHVIEASRPLFIEQGYVATSMRQVADAAGVSLQTLYNAFDSKFGLFSALMDVIVAGDHQPVALADRPEFRALDDIDDPGEYVAAVVAAAVSVLVRLDVIFPTLRAAAESDAEVAAAYRRFVLDARYQNNAQAGERLASMGALRPGSSAAHATDVLWTIVSPDTFHLLAGERGWSAGEFEQWAVDTLQSTLLP